jgi:hypothetical protein
VTTLIFIPSLNTKMHFIVLEKGIFLKPSKALQTRHYYRLWNRLGGPAWNYDRPFSPSATILPSMTRVLQIEHGD